MMSLPTLCTFVNIRLSKYSCLAAAGDMKAESSNFEFYISLSFSVTRFGKISPLWQKTSLRNKIYRTILHFAKKLSLLRHILMLLGIFALL